MWTTRCENLTGQPGLRFALDLDSRPATFADVVRGWQEDAEFCTWFNSLLTGVPYSAFRWETPSVSSATIERPFEFVLLDEPSLNRRPDMDTFAEHFEDSEAPVVVVPNLHKDATLIIPGPLAAPEAYGHLAAFVRLAPEQQRHALWQAVGQAMERRIGVKPVWLSTAGGGVAWLHVRLDDKPKYYGYGSYKLSP